MAQHVNHFWEDVIFPLHVPNLVDLVLSHAPAEDAMVEYFYLNFMPLGG